MSTGYKIHEKDGAHFLTFQVVGWVDLFSCRDYRDVVIESFKFCQQNKGLNLQDINRRRCNRRRTGVYFTDDSVLVQDYKRHVKSNQGRNVSNPYWKKWNNPFK